MNYEELQERYKEIPSELKKLKRWVGYKIQKNSNGDETKVPYNAITGRFAKSNDSYTWTTFNLALKGCAKYGFAGLGFMLGEDSVTKECIFGIDLDNHVNKETGQKPFPNKKDFEEFVSIFVKALDTYTEYSHSLEGAHLLCKGHLPEGVRKRGNVEMYDKYRFFTMTGKVIHYAPIMERTEEIKPLWEKYLNAPREEKIQQALAARPKYYEYVYEVQDHKVKFLKLEAVSAIMPTNIEDNELIDKIRNSLQGTTFMSLYNGETGNYGGDHSRADGALCQILAFWTGCDKAQMDRIFRSSGLMRPKWDEKRGDRTYGEIVIEGACSIQGSVYVPPSEEEIIVENKKGIINPNQPLLEFDSKGDPIIKLKQIFKSYPLTDTGNAERFYDYFGDTFKYNAVDKTIYYWDGTTWRVDKKNIIRKYANKFLEVLKNEIAQTEESIKQLYQADEKDEDEIKHLEIVKKNQLDNLKRVSNTAGKNSMLTELVALHDIPVQNDDLDVDPFLLNTKSGVVNLKTGEIAAFDKKYLMTKNTNCYISYEEPTTFLKFLHDVLRRPTEEETEELINTVRMAICNSLYGRTNKDLLFILSGNGSNGKSTFITVLGDILGDYAVTASSGLLVREKNQNTQSTEFSFASLRGARAIFLSETDEDERFSDKTIKQLTSGSKITAQKKFGDQFNYMPTFSPWLDTNFLANIRSKDDGIWRRIFIIPFDTKFTEETKDINMPSKLKAELPQILGWAIKGFKTYMEVYKEKVPRPKSVDIALSDYKKKMDILNDFIDCRCNIVPGYLTKEETLYKEFKQWCLDSQEPIIKESSFKRDLPLHGFSLKKDIKQGWVVEGLKLISDTRQITFRQVREEDYEL